MINKFPATEEDRKKAQAWLNKIGFSNKLYGISHPTVISLADEFYKERQAAKNAQVHA